MNNKQKLDIDLLMHLVAIAEINYDGKVADYIPELVNANQHFAGIAIKEITGNSLSYSNYPIEPITLQSTSKLVPLIGLLEEFGVEHLLKLVNVEPSGNEFASIAHLENFGPLPANPMLNAGAITLCSHIPGSIEQKFTWLNSWIRKLFNQQLYINSLVLASEKRTGNRNRALAYFLKSYNNLGTSVHETLDLYFSLCSYEATLTQMLYLPTLLANHGYDPVLNKQIISVETCKITIAIMATCGLYNETGNHMVKTGMPAKSGVSGYIIAVLPGKAGIVTLSHLVNSKGNSIRGGIMLEELSKIMNWHFAIY